MPSEVCENYGDGVTFTHQHIDGRRSEPREDRRCSVRPEAPVHPRSERRSPPRNRRQLWLDALEVRRGRWGRPHGWRSAVCLCAVLLSQATPALARRPRRHRFEPTDLALERPGTAEVDVQLGGVAADGPSGKRLVVPDFEVDLGLSRQVELDIDGAFSLDRFDLPTRGWSGDALWTSVKLGLLDSRLADGRSLAAGLQLGPRLPTLGAQGIGYGAVVLVGMSRAAWRLGFNGGALVDPGPSITRGQSISVVAGVDLSLSLDARGTSTALAEIAVARYFSNDPHNVTLTGGYAWSVTPAVQLSVVVLVGLLSGGDRLGTVLGCTSSLPLL